MIGALAGNNTGSIREGAGTKTRRFSLFGPDRRLPRDAICEPYEFDVSCQGPLP